MAKCLLFDCDGTLVDSERLCNVGLVAMFKELGIALDADELLLRFRGWKLANVLILLQEETSVTIPQNFVAGYREKVSMLFEKELKPVKGVENALEKLEYPKAVVSSGPKNKIEQALRLCNLTKYFSGNIYSSYEIGAWKPDPRIYEYAAQDMGYTPLECAVIEDGLVGVEAAVRAGMQTYFYNVHQEKCDWPGVVPFQAMSKLPALIAHNKQFKTDAFGAV